VRCSSCFAYLVFAIFLARAYIRELWVTWHLYFNRVTLPRACALPCSFADALVMPDCSVCFAFITSFGAQGHETCLNADLLSNSKSLNAQIMPLEMHSGAISFVTLFRSHQLFKYFLCSLYCDVSCMSSYQTHFLLERLRDSCTWSLSVCTGHYFIN